MWRKPPQLPVRPGPLIRSAIAGGDAAGRGRAPEAAPRGGGRAAPTAAATATGATAAGQCVRRPLIHDLDH